MADYFIEQLARYDSFRTQTRDAKGELFVSWIIKFVAAQQLICCGVSFSAFRDHLQMGESTGQLCLLKLWYGIVKCPDVFNICLLFPTRTDARCIIKTQGQTWHWWFAGIFGCYKGTLDYVSCFLEREIQRQSGLQLNGSESHLWLQFMDMACFVWIPWLNDITFWIVLRFVWVNGRWCSWWYYFSFQDQWRIIWALYYRVDGIYS